LAFLRFGAYHRGGLEGNASTVVIDVIEFQHIIIQN